jgi:hypothetical protein
MGENWAHPVTLVLMWPEPLVRFALPDKSPFFSFLSCFITKQHLSMPFLKSGLPDGIFSNQKLPIRVNFGGSLQWKMLEYYMSVWFILRLFGIYYTHLEYVVVI